MITPTPTSLSRRPPTASGANCIMESSRFYSFGCPNISPMMGHYPTVQQPAVVRFYKVKIETQIYRTLFLPPAPINH